MSALAKLLPIFIPQLAQKIGVQLPPDLTQADLHQMSAELLGTPAQKQGGNQLINYYKNRHLVSDSQFRELAETVFGIPEMEETSQRFLWAMGQVQTMLAEAEAKKKEG